MQRIIENEYLKVTVSDHGAELVSVIDKEEDTERIWCGAPEVWPRHAPILFPFIGTLKDKTYTYDGKSYPMTSHGFARDNEFKVEYQSDSEIIHSFEWNEETYKVYPFKFKLYVTHTLVERTVEVIWRVINEDTKEMLYCIGGHPAFVLPYPYDYVESGYRFLLSVDKDGNGEIPEKLVYHLPKGGIIQPEEYELPLHDGMCSIELDMFEKDALVVKNGQIRKISILKPDGAHLVSLECDFPFFGIWSKDPNKFVCLEPWCGMADNEGFEGTLEEKEGIEKVAPDREKEYSHKITF